MSKARDQLLITFAALIALFVPFMIMGEVYPFFQLFLPEGNIVIPPGLRIFATIVMAAMDYGIAYLAIHFTSKRYDKPFIMITVGLTFLWNIFVGMLWYLSID